MAETKEKIMASRRRLNSHRQVQHVMKHRCYSEEEDKQFAKDMARYERNGRVKY